MVTDGPIDHVIHVVQTFNQILDENVHQVFGEGRNNSCSKHRHGSNKWFNKGCFEQKRNKIARKVINRRKTNETCVKFVKKSE